MFQIKANIVCNETLQHRLEVPGEADGVLGELRSASDSKDSNDQNFSPLATELGGARGLTAAVSGRKELLVAMTGATSSFLLLVTSSMARSY